MYNFFAAGSTVYDVRLNSLYHSLSGVFSMHWPKIYQIRFIWLGYIKICIGSLLLVLRYLECIT